MKIDEKTVKPETDKQTDKKRKQTNKQTRNGNRETNREETKRDEKLWEFADSLYESSWLAGDKRRCLLESVNLCKSCSSTCNNKQEARRRVSGGKQGFRSVANIHQRRFPSMSKHR